VNVRLLGRNFFVLPGPSGLSAEESASSFPSSALDLFPVPGRDGTAGSGAWVLFRGSGVGTLCFIKSAFMLVFNALIFSRTSAGASLDFWSQLAEALRYVYG
jgi:hypothetical protein